MSDKTNAYWWLPWAVVVAVVLAVGFITTTYANWYFMAPWSSASQVVTLVAINEFETGIAEASPYWGMRIAALTGILLFFVVGPSLWIYGEIKNEAKSNVDVLKKGIAWYAGAILVVAGLQVVPTTVMKAMVFHDTWSAADQHRVHDQLRSQLFKMGYDAVELFYLPRQDGGGSGSFRVATASGSEFRDIQLTDLESYATDRAMSFYLQDTTRGDSTITIHAISDKDGPDPDYNNADGRIGKIEMAITVRPSGDFDYERLNGQ
ncbi:MAG: hypothetical protein U5J63_05815 [Fodinibius sp.]|nr:hypothetical protein [Fodinibius sp.]